jgi:K+-transporting ATPase ATPase A chain
MTISETLAALVAAGLLSISWPCSCGPNASDGGRAMTSATLVSGFGLILVFTALVALLAKPFGLWLFAIYEGRQTPLHRVLGPVERGFYRLAGVNPDQEQTWRQYALHLMLFQVATVIFTYAILRLQGVLPMNPRGLAACRPTAR